MNLQKTAPTAKTSKPSTKKTLNTTKDRDRDTKISPWLEDYLDLQSFRLKPITQASIERIANELIEWSAKEDSIVFRDFYDDKYIPENVYYSWLKKYPELQAAHTLAKGRIGSRREKGALMRKYDGSLIVNSMPMYDNEWKEMVAWKSSLKDQAVSGNVTINLPNIATITTTEG